MEKGRAPAACANASDAYVDEEPATGTRRVLPLAQERPRTRGECVGVARPCPFTTCRYNLVLDRAETAVADTPPESSCALDVADRGGATLEDIAAVFGVTRERVRQIEERALARIRRGDTVLEELAPGHSQTRWNRLEHKVRAFVPAAVEATGSESESPAEEATLRERASFFAPDESADDAVCASVWTMLTKRRS